MSWKFRVGAFATKRAIIWFLLLLSLWATMCTADGPSKKAAAIKRPRPTNATTTTTTTTSTTTTTTTTATSPPPTTESSSGDGSSTASGIAEICIHGLKAIITNSGEEMNGGEDADGKPAAMNVRHESEFVRVIEGDAMLSVFTTDPISMMFVVNRINQANIIEADFEIGVRAILVEEEGGGGVKLAQNLLMQEVQYMQQCITHAIGIFVDHDLYAQLEDFIKVLEYNIWPIPSARAYLFPKAAHLLHQLPWGEKIASVEILTEQLPVYNEFMEAVRHEHMCLMHFKSEDNIYMLFGAKMATHFHENGTIFAVPTERTDRAFIADLPDRAYILMEKEIDLGVIDRNSSLLTLDQALVGQTVLPSRILAFASPLLELMHWLRGSLTRNCRRDSEMFVLESCFNFLTFVGDWRAPEYRNAQPQPLDTARLLQLLHMRQLAPLMNFLLYQKREADVATPLREIASQNYVSNVTTFYHYNRANDTAAAAASVAFAEGARAKFGQTYNCQYSASGDNARYPFLFDGESVMFWRIKADAWVATGMTAAILGVIITLAILVFIVVRISLGDVFEGNPVTSILLLLSLVLLFISFVPFSMEYVGEHRNSHVTFEDAATLNTLCAVRVFIMTLVYCFAFSLLLCRAVMLASIGSEGGFLSHVNGYIQALICVFSVFVQLGMSVQLLVVMHVAAESISCENMYYGHWLWCLLAYDFLLLACIVALVPFVYRSQRNYREGILIVIGAVLILIIWIVWMAVALFGDELRDAAIPLGLQATGWAILIGVLIPRTFLIVRGIERSDIAQALPSLTSLAFAQNNQYSSEQSVYECVNPAMRNCSQEELQQSPSEIPTLPLRGGGPRRQQFFANLRQANANINPQRPPPRPQRNASPHSSQSSLPASPENSKITRF